MYVYVASASMSTSTIDVIALSMCSKNVGMSKILEDNAFALLTPETYFPSLCISKCSSLA